MITELPKGFDPTIPMEKAISSFALRVEPVENGFVIYETGPDAHQHEIGTRHIAANPVQLDRLLAELSRKNIDRMVAQYKPTTPETSNKD